MGCGSSTENKPQHTVVNKQLVTSVTSFQATHTGKRGENSSPNSSLQDNMLKRNARKSADVSRKETSSPPPKSMEERIKGLPFVSEEDAQEALLLADKHPEMKEDFAHMVNIMQEVVRKERYQFVTQLQTLDKANGHAMDFLALIGGAKATVEIYTDLLKTLGVTHVTEKLLRESRSGDRGNVIELLGMIRFFWVDATDDSSVFAARLADAKLFPFLMEDVKNLGTNFDAEDEIFDESMSILHNCSKNKALRPVFRDIELARLLIPILARKEKAVKLLSLLTLSYIIDEEDNHLLLADDSDFDFLLENISIAFGNDVHRTPTGYSLEELLKGVGNLVQNDDNKKLLMKKGALVHLKPILKDGQDGEKQEAAKIIWELAFDKDNKRLMKEDKDLMKQLNTLKGSSHHGVAKSCGGALWVLDMETRLGKAATAAFGGKSSSSPAPSLDGDQLFSQLAGAPPPPSGWGDSALPPPPPPQAGPGHVMISYNWGNQKMMMQVRDSLRANGFKVWMDVDNISGSTLQAMAEAVEGASAVLVCMSQRYKDSPNCRTEAEYAFSLQKPIIPLLLERSYKPDGWLGILKGSKLFFDFSGKYPYEKKFDELVRELGFRGKNDSAEVDGPILGEKAQPVASAPAQDITSWSQKDINNWITKNHLNDCPKLKTLTGENIKFLQKLSHRAPEFYFNYLKQDLGLSSLNDLMHFSDAIDKLP